MPCLYLVEIGGTREDCLFELHSVHPLVARDEADLLAQCRAKFARLYDAPHVDGWIALPLAERAQAPAAADARFYAVEMGRNSASHLREEHRYLFLEAAGAREALMAARAQMPGWHIDTVVDLDTLADRFGHALRRKGDLLRQPAPTFVSRYIRLDRM